MEEKLVSREVAELAKEKGFNWCVGYVYSSKGLHQIYDSSIYENMNGTRYEITPNVYPNPPYYSAPTQTLLQKWLREVHNIDIFAFSCRFTGYEEIGYYTFSIKGIIPVKNYKFKIYEEALEVGLLEALKLIKL